MQKSAWQHLWDFIGVPFRLVLFDQKWLPTWGWTTLEDERLMMVKPHIQGKLLDIGAGPNTLVHLYEGQGQGVDVFDWGGGTIVVEDTAKLPFDDHSFDTVTLIACLNHIPNRQEVLHEVARLLKPDGQVVITMINPLLGDIGHAIWWYSEDKHRGGMKEGELGGMWKSHVLEVCQNAGFELKLHRRFVYGMNNLYIFRKKRQGNGIATTQTSRVV